MSDRCPQCNRPLINKVGDVCLYCKAPLPQHLRQSEEEKRADLRATQAALTRELSLGKENMQVLADRAQQRPVGFNKHVPLWVRFLERFVPKHNELSVYLIALTFVLLWWKDSTVRNYINQKTFYDLFVYEGSEIDLILLVGMSCLIWGAVVYSLLNIFFKRRLTGIELVLMLCFAIITSTIFSIYASFYLIMDGLFGRVVCHWILLVMPVSNLATSLLSVYFVGSSIACESFDELYSEDLTTFKAFLLHTVFTVITFFVCHDFLREHWAVTFCTCLAVPNWIQLAFNKYQTKIECKVSGC